MRCLRALAEAQYTGHVSLSDDNLQTLNDELQQNFRINADDQMELLFARANLDQF